jgi:hypothetical protein
MLPVLGLFMMAAPVSTDMILPALMTLSRELNATPGQAQLTLSYFFLGFALGQLVWGGTQRPFRTPPTPGRWYRALHRGHNRLCAFRRHSADDVLSIRAGVRRLCNARDRPGDGEGLLRP